MVNKTDHTKVGEDVKGIILTDVNLYFDLSFHDFHLSIYVFSCNQILFFSLFSSRHECPILYVPLAQTAFNTNENLKLALIADAFQISWYPIVL